MKDYLSEDFSVGPSIANWSPPASPSPPPASSGIAKYFDNKIFMILKLFAHYKKTQILLGLTCPCMMH